MADAVHQYTNPVPLNKLQQLERTMDKSQLPPWSASDILTYEYSFIHYRWQMCCVLASWRLSAFRSRPHTELISSTDTDSALLCIVVCIFNSALGSFYCTARLTLFVLLPPSFSLLLKRSCLIAWSTRLRLPAASATFSALLSACHKTTAIYHLFCIFSQLKMISMHFAFQILLQETRP